MGQEGIELGRPRETIGRGFRCVEVDGSEHDLLEVFDISDDGDMAAIWDGYDETQVEDVRWGG